MTQPDPTNDPNYPPLKPGWATTEFWVTIITTVVSAVIALAALLGHNLDGSNLQPLIGFAAMLAAGAATAYYNHSRGTTKAAHQQAQAYHMVQMADLKSRQLLPVLRTGGANYGGVVNADIVGGSADNTGADGVGGAPTERART